MAAAHWNPPRATPEGTVCHRKKKVRDAAHQGLPERSRDRVDGCSITPDIFLDSGTPAAPPRATPTAPGHLSGLPKCSAVGYHVRRTRPDNVPKKTFFLHNFRTSTRFERNVAIQGRPPLITREEREGLERRHERRAGAPQASQSPGICQGRC